MANDRWRDDDRQRWFDHRDRERGDLYRRSMRPVPGQRYLPPAPEQRYATDEDYRYGGEHERDRYESDRYRDGWRGGYESDWRRAQELRNADSIQSYESGRSSESGPTQSYGNRDDYGHERDWWDRTKDEVRSWMGDEEAERRRRRDINENPRRYGAARGGHYGRGPKGYTRSDQRILEDVCDRLMENWNVDASDIEVAVVAGEVTLTGTVDGRDAKRRAEDIAADVTGVKDVQNNLRVRQQQSLSGARSSQDDLRGSSSSALESRPRH